MMIHSTTSNITVFQILLLILIIIFIIIIIIIIIIILTSWDRNNPCCTEVFGLLHSLRLELIAWNLSNPRCHEYDAEGWIVLSRIEHAIPDLRTHVTLRPYYCTMFWSKYHGNTITISQDSKTDPSFKVSYANTYILTWILWSLLRKSRNTV